MPSGYKNIRDIQPLVNDKCPGFFEFCRNLASTKNKEITDKASEHNGR